MAGSISNNAESYFHDMAQLLGKLDSRAINTMTDWLYSAWQNDQQVFIFGNGGSAYTASHYVTDIVKTAHVQGQRRLRAISLVDNYGLTTALGNDISYEQTFSYPLESYGRPGDLAIAISGSGNSPNVVLACQWAKAHGLRLVCLTGFTGGKIADLADLHIHVPSDNYGLIEDLHMSVGHVITQAFKSRLMQEVGVQ